MSNAQNESSSLKQRLSLAVLEEYFERSLRLVVTQLAPAGSVYIQLDSGEGPILASLHCTSRQNENERGASGVPPDYFTLQFQPKLTVQYIL